MRRRGIFHHVEHRRLDAGHEVPDLPREKYRAARPDTDRDAVAARRSGVDQLREQLG